ncbi:Bug family tripartite tricarboxylate transporter substrate binding protein [Variovorax saccharolyticus]|uniref:Bug family tripartite tricarboxylate transporter substrate binding protein n=1 Tax=Variovorax saccharolyticus TaxID=3053516 RepID=UPI0025780AA7|nr:tripartite tricarboxylate transporter substrate binding protein [Variovorax sp. J22R187]MDM0022234.1 tripartite tricarboxylate transporter substrate binding protein [Variovorax sp. J22R187]
MRFSSQVQRLVAVASIAIASSAVVPVSASAQTAWPSRPITLIVPFAAGGGTDPIARAIATKLSGRLGQPVIVDNRGGAGGTMGTSAVAKSPPDGYTILIASTSISTNVSSGKKLPYDPAKDLAPIGQVGASPLLIVVSSESKATTLKELLSQARANPGTINYGSGGLGVISHLGVELLARGAGVQLVHVPYKGMAPAFTDMLGGSIQMLMPSPATATPHIAGGKVRALAVTSAQRSQFMPNVPTVAESGVPGFQVEFWWGLLGPSGMPQAVVKRLNEELNWALSQPDIRDLLARDGAVPKPGTPEDFRKLIAFELDRWNKLVKDANIKTD